MSDRKFVSRKDIADAMARLQQIVDSRAKPAPSSKSSVRILVTAVLAAILLATSFVLHPITNRHGGPAPCNPPGSACHSE